MCIRSLLLCLAALASALLAGCNHRAQAAREVAYVSAPQAFLRDKVSAVFTKVGTVSNGERIEITAHERRFVKVKTSGGTEGWVELRYLVPEHTYSQFADLAAKYADAPAQARAAARDDVNMHLSPSRDSEKLFQIKQGEKLDLIERAIAPRNPPAKTATPKAQISTVKVHAKNSMVASPPASPAPKPAETDPATPNPLEDWWLVRTSNGHAGWVLGRMLDVDVPLDVAQYAEGKRIVAANVLTTVVDPESDKPDRKVPYYLVVMNENHDGQTQDFSSLRVFTWNLRRHRYETAYREHDLNGYLPVSVAKEEFGREGVEPTFTIREKDESGAAFQRKYRLEGVLVKRVYAPGEEPQTSHSATPSRRAAHRHRRRRH